MASTNGASTRVGDTESSLERIKRQLASGSGRNLLQGPLLKRSETVNDLLSLDLLIHFLIFASVRLLLRKWNERWVILDPTTGKMEYKTRRNEPTVKGTIIFDENSTITLSPVNFHAVAFFLTILLDIGTPQKKDYFLCAETPGAARAWVSTLQLKVNMFNSLFTGKSRREPAGSLANRINWNAISQSDDKDGLSTYIQGHFSSCSLGCLSYLVLEGLGAAQLVLKAHKEAVNSLSGTGSAKLGTVAAVVAAANSTALECSKEIEAAMQISLRNALGMVTNRITDGPMDDLTIMKYVKSWDSVLPQAEFAYNNSVNRSIKKTPFEATYGLKPQTVFDLVPLPQNTRVSDEGEAFAEHIRAIHEERERFPKGTYHKLKARKFGPWSDGDMRAVTDQIQQLPIATRDTIEDSLDVREVRSRRGSPYRHFLVKWLGKPASESTWIAEEELKKVDPEIYDEYLKETLRVKDEELQNLARDLRARDSTIREIADKLSETAEAAEAAASAAHTMDEQRRIACAEIERVTQNSAKQLETSMLKLREYEEKVMALSKEKDQLIKHRDSALQEAHLWRSELAKARERVVILEAAVVRGEEKVRVAEADAEARIKEAAQKEADAVKSKEELLAYVNMLQSQLQRQQIDTKQVFEEKTESSNTDNSLPQTKDVDLSEENVDKACLSVSRAVPVPGESVVHMTVDQVNHRAIRDGEWSDIQATEARIADVREVAPETEGSSLDISVVSTPINNNHEQGANSFHQP
ncbi:hypothetical protein JRO89_XS01G0382900 [Xanthoceras sorbifolium]|uniref:PH domain-containing protein n=1 Tax=Xanthoceras sorbifolium TaxID=99658 RepID=A0ABQ8INZ9_9ROSI|nr:hypothetical protein JRO89_XS01G0382900 [Xanthoceras sorbifolium]